MNWGKGITIGITLFMLFIISFVIRAFQFDFERLKVYQFALDLISPKGRIPRACPWMNGSSPKGRRAKLVAWKQVPRAMPVGFPQI